MDTIISQEEKIDYIYTTLKKQEARYKRKIYYKILIALLIFAYSYYMYLLLMPKIQSMIGSIQKIQQTGNPTTSIDLENVKGMLEGLVGKQNNF